jgi:hypothetical protein
MLELFTPQRTAMDPKPYKPPVRELASRIYAELVLRSVTVSENGVKMAIGADNLAKLSFRLADAFQEVEEALQASDQPKKAAFTLAASDIAEWSK